MSLILSSVRAMGWVENRFEHTVSSINVSQIAGARHSGTKSAIFEKREAL
jgi:hypothetical protein